MRFRFLVCAALFLPLMSHAMPGYFEPWGKDSDLKLVHEEPVKAPEQSLAVAVARKIIHFHQTVISPVDGPRSHYRPSSSEYMQQAMEKHGFFKGFIMGCDRLLRENKDPWVYRNVEWNGQLYKYDPPR